MVHQNKVRALKREEREKFVGSFAQAKNLIEKQMKIGNHLRDRKRAKDVNRKVVDQRKAAKTDELMALPITTKQIDGMLFDQELDMAAMSQDMKARSGTMGMRRGASQGTTAVQSQMSLNRSGISEQVPRRRNVRINHSAQRKPNLPIHKQGVNYKQQALLPPLNETSFSEQYKTFKALGGYGRVTGGNELDMARDLEMRLKPAAQNRPFIKRTFQKPVFTEESFPMMQVADRSVFQTNASYMLSPNNMGAETQPGSHIKSSSIAFNSQMQADVNPLFTSNMQAQPASVDYSAYQHVGGHHILENTGDSAILSPIGIPPHHPQFHGAM